jgi:hypothetical protein
MTTIQLKDATFKKFDEYCKFKHLNKSKVLTIIIEDYLDYRYDKEEIENE